MQIGCKYFTCSRAGGWVWLGEYLYILKDVVSEWSTVYSGFTV